jgi:MFS family permease
MRSRIVAGSAAAGGIASTSQAAPGTALREWRHGWPVVVAGIFGFVLAGTTTMSMGAFMAPIQDAFGWNRAEFSLGYSVHMLPGFVVPPLVGILIDRYGPRWVAVCGALAFGVTYSLLATATGSIANWLLLWLLLGAAGQVTNITLWCAAVSSVFSSSRGLALTVVMCGTAAAASLWPLLSNWLIEHYDFRTALFAIGAATGGTVALLAWFGLSVVPRPRRPEGREIVTPSPAEAEAEAVAAPGLTVREGVRSPFFYKLLVLIIVSYGVVLSLTLHMIPLLTAAGLARGTAVMIAGSYGIALIVGKLVVGAVLDRVPARFIAIATNVVLIACLILFAIPNPGVPLSMVAVLLLGIAYGMIGPTVPYLASRYLGMRSYGRLFGIATTAYAVGASVGPWLAGHVYDVTHSYRLFLLGNIPLALIAIALCATLGPYPDFEKAAG